MNAIIEIKFPRAVCVDLYRENKVLGRFMLRYSGKTLAAGVVTEVCLIMNDCNYYIPCNTLMITGVSKNLNQNLWNNRNVTLRL